MAATWTIESLERTFELNEESNVVTKIHWNCNDSTTVGEDTYSGRVSGTQPLDTSDLEDFVAYADVTEEVALGWLMDSEDEGFQDVVEAKVFLGQQLRQLKTKKKKQHNNLTAWSNKYVSGNRINKTFSGCSSSNDNGIRLVWLASTDSGYSYVSMDSY